MGIFKRRKQNPDNLQVKNKFKHDAKVLSRFSTYHHQKPLTEEERARIRELIDSLE